MTTRISHSSLANAADALRLEEVKRTREILRIGWIVALGAAVAVLIAPGDPQIRKALLAALGSGVVGSAWMHLQLANPQRFSPARMNLLAAIAVICGQLGILYVGAFSAAPLMVASSTSFSVPFAAVDASVATPFPPADG